MNIIGQPIRHKAFGSGVVTSVDAGIITVRFREEDKRFIYPDAFRDYMVLQDKELQKNVARLLTEMEAKAERRRRLEQELEERRRKLRNYTVTANSHAVFNIAPEETEQVFRTCTVSTGVYLSGLSKGKPRPAERLKPNSAILLTVRPHGAAEKERQIVGAFMVREDFFGEEAVDGSITGHPEHRLLLPEGCSLSFWEHFSRGTVPPWGNKAFKYCAGTSVNRALYAMVRALEGTEQHGAALAFYAYFCKLNGQRAVR